MKNLYIIILLSFLSSSLYSQFGIGLTASNDLYQRYSNPEDGLYSPSAGSAMLNLGVGPKIWVGGTSFSISVESQAKIGLVGFSLKDNKGFGMVGIPVIMRFNFEGMSALSREGRMGLTIGGGIQYNRTELYGLKTEFEDAGVTRDFFRTIVAQLGYGFGISGFSVHGIVQYGWDPNTKANSINFGLQYDFNLPMMKKINDPNSAL